MFKSRRFFVFLIVILGFFLYFHSLKDTFVWDDEEQILANTAVHSLTDWPTFFTGSTFNNGGASTSLMGLYYKPLMTFSFAILYAMFGLIPFYFHLFQLVIHITNAILVFLIFYYLFKALLGHKAHLAGVLGPAAAGSLIFLVHPLLTEAVVYSASLQDVLFTFFGLLAFLIVVKGHKLERFFAVAFLLLLSLLSKETGVVFFAIILTYVLIFRKKDESIAFVLAAFLSVGFYAFMRFGVAHIGLQKQNLSPISRAGFAERMQTVPEIIFYYVSRFFWPSSLAISQHFIVPKIDFSGFFAPAAFDLVFFIVLACGYFLINRNDRSSGKLYIFFFLWFVFALGIHLQIFPLDMTVADRWFYLPMIGLIGCIGVILKDYINLTSVKIILVIIVAVMSVRTFTRTLDWKDGLTLFGHDERIVKNSFDLENNLGVELFRAGRFAEAKSHFEASARLAPYWWTNWNNLGAIAERQGDFSKAENDYKKAIKNGKYYLAVENLATLLIRVKKYAEAKKFLQDTAIPNFPDNAIIQNDYLYLQNLK